MLRVLLLAFAFAAPGALAAPGWYAELHAGTTRATDAGGERVEGAYGIGIGVAHNRWFSTQLDWHTLGEDVDIPSCPIVCTTPPPLPEHGYALRAIPRLPLGERFAIELGLGLMKWEGDYSIAGAPYETSGTDPWYSLGVAWRFGERWSLTLEQQLLDAEAIDFDWTGATLRYRF